MKEPRPGDRVRVTYEDTVVFVHGTGEIETSHLDGLIPSEDVEVIEPADDPSKDPVGTVAGFATNDRKFIRWSATADAPWAEIATSIPQRPRVFTDEQMADREIIGAVPGTPAWYAWLSGELTGTEHRLTEVVKLDDIFPNAADTAAVDEGVKADSDPYPRYWKARDGALYRVQSPGANLERRDPGGEWEKPWRGWYEGDIIHPRYYPWTGDGSEEPPDHVQQAQDSQGYVVTRAAGGWLCSRTGRTDPWNVAYAAYGLYTEVIE